MIRRAVLPDGPTAAAQSINALEPASSPVYFVVTQGGPRHSRISVPVGCGPAPCVLLLHGSEGPNRRVTDTMAMFLASQGFVAAPFPYSRGGNAWHAGDIVDIELSETVKLSS